MKIVAEELPLKQGLKRKLLAKNSELYDSCRGTSIKTRIETVYWHKYIYEYHRCRGTSIKTRIETSVDKFVHA